MGLFRPDGTRVTKASVATSTETVTYVTIDEDLMQSRRYSRYDSKPEGDERVLFGRAGKRRLTQAEFDNLFPAASVESIAPNTGPIAGGTVVTVSGPNMDGVTAVTFGGTAGVNLTVVSGDELTVETPAAPGGVAGAVDVVLTDDAGDTTVTAGFTYE